MGRLNEWAEEGRLFWGRFPLKTRRWWPRGGALVFVKRCPGFRQSRSEFNMKNPVMDLPLVAVMREEIALSLQGMRIFTVGSFLMAWRNPRNQVTIEQIFDSPQQARNAAAICANWLGYRTPAEHRVVGGWWKDDNVSLNDQIPMTNE
jgi:hypothetical protein